MKLIKRLLLTMAMVFTTLPVLAEQPTIEVFKSPNCGCCKHWLFHLEENGFKVISHDEENMSKIKSRFGISKELTSCHTGVIGDYFIEGHVPASDIKKLLTENPKIKGLSVPGMPAGDNVPGMETRSGNANFDVLAVSNDSVSIYTHYE
ncbi:MAG: hypothetical protein ACI8Q1_002466 [Parvicella sp.]|jgi:hypothetical protein